MHMDENRRHTGICVMSAWPRTVFGVIPLAVMIGGACGAVSRSCLNSAAMDTFGATMQWGGMAFPVGILCINVLGAFTMGLLQGWFRNPVVNALVGVGYLGGFTTVSTFSLNTFTLYGIGGPMPALVNIFANTLLSITAAGLGYTLLGKVAEKK